VSKKGLFSSMGLHVFVEIDEDMSVDSNFCQA
jgi:hypothetical protein